MNKKKILKSLFALFILLFLYLLFWPVPVDPESWTAPIAPKLEGQYALNTKLTEIERITLPDGVGPEDVAVDSQQRIYAGLLDGRVIRLQPDGTGIEELINTKGRPLGLHFDAQEDLIIADADKGLLKLSKEGKLEVLSTEAGGVPYRFTDDLDISADGLIYFSDASFKFPVWTWKLDILESRPNGRLLVYDPKTKETKILLKDLYFANGVALSPDESFLLVNETSRYRILRYWLKGEKKGTSEIFIDNLPGFPDGVSCNDQDRFWVAIVAPRNPLIDKIAPYPSLRKIVVRLPKMIQPKAEKVAFILGLDLEGKVKDNLQDPKGTKVFTISSVQQAGDYLYLGTLKDSAIGKIKAP